MLLNCWLPAFHCLQGVAFTNVRRGMPGMAYFAGVSLSYSGDLLRVCHGIV